MSNESNRILLAGIAAEGLTYSHRIFGESFYNFKLSVMRRSGVYDLLPVTISERLLSSDIAEGERYGLSGQIRTYNECENGRNHLKIVVFCREIFFPEAEEKICGIGRGYDERIALGPGDLGCICGEQELSGGACGCEVKRASGGEKRFQPDISCDRNEAVLRGFLCRKPYYRVSPLGREICDIMLAVNRIHGKSDYIPCIAWGRNARFVSTLNIGSCIEVRGRLQSRTYKKTLSDGSHDIRTAYELSVMSMECKQEE